MTVHLVYPHRRRNTTPDVIGWRLADRLAQRWPTVVHDWDWRGRIAASPGDVLIGHPHPLPGTVLRRSWDDPAWARRFVLAPYSGDPQMVAFEDRFVRSADRYFALTGQPWFDAMPSSVMSHWADRAVRLDLAIDRSDVPRIKASFAPAGRRRFLYIGRTTAVKNPAFLEAVAAALPDSEFGWIGHGRRRLAGFHAHGPLPTDTSKARSIIAGYDFLIVLSRADANPTVVLEAMGWGLVPFATRTAGYCAEDGVVEVPLDDVDGAAAVLSTWQRVDDSVLTEHRRRNDLLLDQRYTWDRFCSTIIEEIGRDRSGAATGSGRRHQSRELTRAKMLSPLLRDRGLWRATLSRRAFTARPVVWSPP